MGEGGIERRIFNVYSNVQKNRGNASDIEYISHARMIGKVFYACHIGRQRARLYDSDKRARATNLV